MLPAARTDISPAERETTSADKAREFAVVVPGGIFRLYMSAGMARSRCRLRDLY